MRELIARVIATADPDPGSGPECMPTAQAAAAGWPGARSVGEAARTRHLDFRSRLEHPAGAAAHRPGSRGGAARAPAPSPTYTDLAPSYSSIE